MCCVGVDCCGVMAGFILKQDWSDARVVKFRQAAFVYLHVAILYEAAAYVMMGGGGVGVPTGARAWFWLGAGAFVGGLVFVGLYRWRNVWFARVIWVIHGLRLPFLIEGAFFAAADSRAPPSFHMVAIVVVMINLWMLARAGWDL